MNMNSVMCNILSKQIKKSVNLTVHIIDWVKVSVLMMRLPPVVLML